MVGESNAIVEGNLKSISDDAPFSKLLDEGFKRELTALRKKQEQHSRAVQKMRNNFRFKEGLIKEEQ